MRVQIKKILKLINSSIPLTNKRYLYGNKIDFEPSELLETYMAGNKYLFHHWNFAISEYLKERLNADNCVSIFDQLFRTNNVELSWMAKNFIANHSVEAFRSSAFIELSRDALIDLLKFDELRLVEINMLRSVSKWVSVEVERQGLARLKGIADKNDAVSIPYTVPEMEKEKKAREKKEKKERRKEEKKECKRMQKEWKRMEKEWKRMQKELEL